ncbi:transcriptional activator hap3 [Exophiala dermatitidis]|nr:transcriptional activator hap3 [Exophiala dermatitidis]
MYESGCATLHLLFSQQSSHSSSLLFSSDHDFNRKLCFAVTGAVLRPLRGRLLQQSHIAISGPPVMSSDHDPKHPSSSRRHGQRGSSSSSSAMSDANIRNSAPVARIMKTALPENAKIAKEAKECMQECVSEFISFITSEASEKCQQEKRKTVNGEDILFAMTSLGFENYAEALKIYLSKYRETQSTRGENQNRPTSSGYGGPVGGSSVPGNTATGSASGYGQSENSNDLLNQGHGLNATGHDTTNAYGYPDAVPTGHNGISNDNF